MRLVLYAVLTIGIMVNTPGCGLFTRSPEAENIEPEAPEPLADTAETIENTTENKLGEFPDTHIAEPAHYPARHTPSGEMFKDPSDVSLTPQQIQAEPKAIPAPENQKISEARELFNKALKNQMDTAYSTAFTLWKEYVERFPGMPGYDEANFNLGLSAFHLGRLDVATQAMEQVIESTSNSAMAVDARLVLAECRLREGRYDSALALTFEALPDHTAEQKAGLTRSSTAIGGGTASVQPHARQAVRLLTLRGRIYASLGNEAKAQMALKEARRLLRTAPEEQLSREDRISLAGDCAWREIEVVALSCKHRYPRPEYLSEEEFLTYVEAYYGCTARARQLFCEVRAANDEQVRTQALQTYRKLVEAPLELRDPLPPPSRLVQTQQQRTHYEREMREFIEKTVRERAKSYRNIESCQAYDVF